MLQFPERDLFLRGVRAFVGFKQTGVDYVRPERMFGRTTNSLLKNIGWAKKGILSFSNTPLTMLSFLGGALFLRHAAADALPDAAAAVLSRPGAAGRDHDVASASCSSARSTCSASASSRSTWPRSSKR